ncbi:NAD(P)H-dependent oxidoreductase [Niastella sp. OAS944]|jgi:putative NADPH-quinone reductase|uniref:NAD(P)H-dependent oxidoreductase n=1 Tax=Niastella sp. OAS944 TaxID=2664089 RepID=UPI00346EB4B3|nr:putative NADPH-quinone reductase [Chitinophagaceae bacterium OAS944]
MKTLIVVIHPNLSSSVINKRWVQELQKHPDKYVVHNLYSTYPNGIIDIAREQQLIESFDKIIFQFPFYWFNCPPLFKQWLDEVLTYGWAYGSKSGYKVQNKKIGLAITAGIDEEEYTTAGKYKYTLKELTAPFEITFAYVKANYQPLFAYYGFEYNVQPEKIEKSVLAYLSYVAAFNEQ